MSVLGVAFIMRTGLDVTMSISWSRIGGFERLLTVVVLQLLTSSSCFAT